MSDIHDEIMMWRKHMAECRLNDVDYINNE